MAVLLLQLSDASNTWAPKCFLPDISVTVKGAPSWWWLAVMVTCSPAPQAVLQWNVAHAYTAILHYVLESGLAWVCTRVYTHFTHRAGFLPVFFFKSCFFLWNSIIFYNNCSYYTFEVLSNSKFQYEVNETL